MPCFPFINLNNQRYLTDDKPLSDICVSYKGIRYPLELKIKGHKSQKESIEQLKSYMNKCLASEGWLVVFDKDFTKPWKEKISWDTIQDNDKSIHVVSC
jgi:hypothetical protein